MSARPLPPGPDDIEAGKSRRGGFTRKTLEGWGVPWPPPKGWRRALERRWWQEVGRPAAMGEGGFEKKLRNVLELGFIRNMKREIRRLETENETLRRQLARARCRTSERV